MSPRPGALLCPPVPGPFSVPPSRADPGPPTGRTPKVKNVFRFKIDAKSIPEALATTILILQKFSIDLAHPWGSRGIGPPHPSGTPHRHPWAPPEHPLSTPGHSRGTFEYKNRGSSRDFFSRGEPRIMYSFALGQPGQSGQISFRERKM